MWPSAAAFISVLVSVTLAASEDYGRCLGGSCLPAAALSAHEDAALAMLQREMAAADRGQTGARADKKLAHRQPSPDLVEAVWQELKASVEIARLTEAINNATSGELAASLKEKLAYLQQHFPASGQLRDQFSVAWDNITKAVDMELLQEKLQDAGSTWRELEKQLQALKGHVPDLDIDNIKAKSADVWAQLQDQGVPLPDLNNLTAAAQDALKQVQGAAQGVVSSAKDVVSGAVDSLKDWLR